MRKLTFKGFLTQYVKKLSFSNTLSINRLADEALSGNYRLRAPLVLYAVKAEKTELLLGFLEKHEDTLEMQRMLSVFSETAPEELFACSSVPNEYLKVWNSFLVAQKAPARDQELKAAMRKKVLSLQAEKNCSNYRLYTDLKLNPGNINSWLKSGDCNKVSFRTAERVMDYILSYRQTR